MNKRILDYLNRHIQDLYDSDYITAFGRHWYISTLTMAVCGTTSEPGEEDGYCTVECVGRLFRDKDGKLQISPWQPSRL